MLKSIKLVGVGPAGKMNAEFAKHINVLTGDNGLGKSFLLDVAWWALTRTWAGTPATPTHNRKIATISYVVEGKSQQAAQVRSEFRFKTQTWPIEVKRPPAPGLVVYARVDGGFSVWDPARNDWMDKDPERPTAYHFNKSEVWDGLTVAGKTACEGLERDWVSWQRAQTEEFRWLANAVESLSPPDEPITAGEPRRVFIGEGRERPTISIAGEEVPLVLASAGVRRILALAYLLVWSWREHCLETELKRGKPDSRLVLLFDEPETHLHPRWQRSILPSILRAADGIRSSGAATQILTATHSPLVLASLEPSFDEAHDAWLDLDRTQNNGAGHVELRRREFQRRGDVSSWLTSDAFDLGEARSLEAEKAITAARTLARSTTPLPKADIDRVDKMLRGSLSDIDRFWVRWTQFKETHSPTRSKKRHDSSEGSSRAERLRR